MNKKMTIFYKLKDNTIDIMSQGTQTLAIYSAIMDIEIAEIVYGVIVMDYNEYMFKHRNEFELIKDDTGNLTLQMKESVKEQIKNFV